MKTVNALTVRNRLGEVLDYLERTGQPVLVSKGRQVRAALVPIEDFRRRFLDRQAEDRRAALLAEIHGLRRNRIGDRDSVETLREIREGRG